MKRLEAKLFLAQSLCAGQSYKEPHIPDLTPGQVTALGFITRLTLRASLTWFGLRNIQGSSLRPHLYYHQHFLRQTRHSGFHIDMALDTVQRLAGPSTARGWSRLMAISR